MLAGADDSDEDFDEDGLSTEAVEGPSKIGKKKAEKMAAKAEKKVEREAMQKELEEKKKQREKDDEEARYCWLWVWGSEFQTYLEFNWLKPVGLMNCLYPGSRRRCS